MLHNTPFPVLAVVGAPRGPYGATAPNALVLSLSQNLAASGAGTVFLRNCQIKVSPVRVFLERRILRHCQDLSQAVAVWSAPLMVELEAHALASTAGASRHCAKVRDTAKCCDTDVGVLRRACGPGGSPC
jgi:hypothetical protein